jgi:hypothetical protein
MKWRCVQERRLVSRIMLVLLLGLANILPLLAAYPSHAAPRQRCFAETNYCISGPILSYWERNGGLQVFGYPISTLSIETVEDWRGPVQWFERDRLEDHGSSGVMAGRLGVRALELVQGRAWDTLPRIQSAPQGCRFFPETGHSLCGVFLTYWQRHGGLERFGYPISEPTNESQSVGDTLWTGTVQYFERRRMEHHIENARTPYEVLLGRLGSFIRSYDISVGPCAEVIEPLRKTAEAYAESFVCPQHIPQSNIPLAVQQFERGMMVWVSMIPTFSGGDYSGTIIYVIYFDTQRNSLVWEAYPDDWKEGNTVPSETPPAGLYAPIRSFGQLWFSNPHIRYTLGWATAPEQADSGNMQAFSSGNGRWLLHRVSSDRVYLFYKDGRLDDISRIR